MSAASSEIKPMNSLELLVFRFEIGEQIKEFQRKKALAAVAASGAASNPKAGSSSVASESSQASASANAAADRKAKKAAARLALGGGANAEKFFATTLTAEEIGVKPFGLYPLNQSQIVTGRTWTNILDLTEAHANQTVLVRGRIHTCRLKGKKACFIVLRDALESLQAVAFAENGTTEDMMRFMDAVPRESIVDIQGTVVLAHSPIQAVSKKTIELSIQQYYVVQRATQALPFTVEDASNVDTADGFTEESAAKANKKLVTVSQDIRLDHRVIDLRVPANMAIFRIQSAIGTYFREYLVRNGFFEIHTPKLISAASEGGASVFKLQYFDRPAFLAQSPQLYKQMACACGSLGRVFEIGPVFRAEDSNTHRHLCEFTGLDFEMTFTEHYHEVLDVINDLMVYVFDSVFERHQYELGVISQQYPFEPLRYSKRNVRVSFREAVDLLRADGATVGDYDDLDTPTERRLGELIRKKYDTDFYCLDKFPVTVRPFYTMPDPVDPKYSNSYDWFVRGEEILSGAQRVHDYELLMDRATSLGIDISTIQAYVDSFGYGAFPHAGCGIGLERILMLMLGLKNVRRVSMFPRDPKRLTP